jgi:hypothetical protein
MMGSVLGAVSKAADAVQNAGAAVAGQVMAGALNGLATGLESAVGQVEKPFDTVAKDVITKNHAEMVKVYVDYINGYKFTNPTLLVRGAGPPWTEDSYKAVASDAITKWLCEAAKAEIKAKLKPVAENAIKEHAVTQIWNTTIENWNQLIDKMQSYTDLKSKGIEKITFDLDDYVVDEIYNEITKVMAAYEGETRTNPVGKSPNKPTMFAKIFSGQTLMASDYQLWATEA